MAAVPPSALPWHRREDTWAILIALGLVISVSGAFFAGAAKAVATAALTIPTWSQASLVLTQLRGSPGAPLALFAVFVAAFSIASSIGFTTRFRELAKFGWRPLAAFAVGVLVNVPLGYWLSTSVFAGYWSAVK